MSVKSKFVRCRVSMKQEWLSRKCLSAGTFLLRDFFKRCSSLLTIYLFVFLSHPFAVRHNALHMPIMHSLWVEYLISYGCPWPMFKTWWHPSTHSRVSEQLHRPLRILGQARRSWRMASKTAAIAGRTAEVTVKEALFIIWRSCRGPMFGWQAHIGPKARLQERKYLLQR